MFSYKGYVFRYNSSYVKMFFDRGLTKDYSIVECGKFYRLIGCLVGDNQLLGYRKDKIRPIRVEQMTKIFGCEKRAVYNFLAKMKKDKIIKEVKINGEKWYAVNPLYAMKGKYLSITAFIIFKDELIDKLPYSVVNKFISEARELEDKIEIEV